MKNPVLCLIAGVAAIWVCTAWMSAETPNTAAGPAEAGHYASLGPHPHAMGAQATQVPAGDAKTASSDGCLTCHKGATDPHPVAQSIGCVGCHGGDGAATTKEQAHTARPTHPEAWPTAANPKASYTLLNRENWDWIRFVNPSDLRVAAVVCARCHAAIV
ncbi:MAG TPA: hypothetical protein VGY57_09225, partial [Vicinamibacterales bacterium]|nr:hypothetical protein [Vicinamibacterales bacterium]